jgi:hypothetical protein
VVGVPVVSRKEGFWLIAYYCQSFAGLAAVLYGADWGSVLLLAAGSVLLAVWAAVSFVIVKRWWASVTADGGYACLVWGWRGHRLYHWHRPAPGIVKCRRSVGLHVG